MQFFLNFFWSASIIPKCIFKNAAGLLHSLHFRHVQRQVRASFAFVRVDPCLVLSIYARPLWIYINLNFREPLILCNPGIVSHQSVCRPSYTFQFLLIIFAKRQNLLSLFQCFIALSYLAFFSSLSSSTTNCHQPLLSTFWTFNGCIRRFRSLVWTKNNAPSLFRNKTSRRFVTFLNHLTYYNSLL